MTTSETTETVAVDQRRSPLALWRSPADQPRWTRPAILGLAVLAGVVYGWHMGSSIEVFYAAAAGHVDEFGGIPPFASFDPRGNHLG